MGIILDKKTFTYDDLLMVPQFNEQVSSRSYVKTAVKLTNTIHLEAPIIAANMDTICGPELALALDKLGGLGILHRNLKALNVEKAIVWLKEHGAKYIVPSIGLHYEDIARAKLYKELGATAICIDVAHGDCANMLLMISEISKFSEVIAGNVATGEAAVRLAKAGAKCIKVGIGPGSACSTRSVTGHGYPQASAVKEVADALSMLSSEHTLIADGGLRTSGDIAKAIGLGATAVMTGSLFAGCNECADPSNYRGMASAQAQMDMKSKVSNSAAEGVAFKVESGKFVNEVFEQLLGGLRSAMSYTGTLHIADFRKRALFVEVSQSTQRENSTHGQERFKLI